MALMTKIKWAVSFTAIVLALVSGTTLVVPPGKILAHDGAPEMQHDGHPSETVSELKVEIVIREGGQPRLKGQKTHGQVIEVVAGQSVALVFRNEDAVPREFVSPLFSRTEIHFEGRATGMFRKDAAGFRLNPGSTLTLEFVMPHNGFPKMYDVIWCSHDHDKEPESEIKQLLIVMTRDVNPD
jgi:hypothetical protein